MNNTIIGIDPAFRQSGFAICILDLTENTANFKVFENGFIDFFFWVLYECPADCFWSLENSNLQPNTLFGYDRMSKNEVKSRGISVGKNMATSQIVSDFLGAKFGRKNVKDFSPREKGEKIESARFTAYASAYKLYNYKGLKGEQDKRDAFKIANLAIMHMKIRNYTNTENK